MVMATMDGPAVFALWAFSLDDTDMAHWQCHRWLQ